MSRPLRTAIGIDLGGTKLAAALVDETGMILNFQKESILKLKLQKSPIKAQRQIVELMAQMILQMRERHPEAFSRGRLQGVGLASAGPLDVKLGLLKHPVNFPNWKIVPLVDLLKRQLSTLHIKAPLHFQNDAIAASLAESWTGNARGLSTFATITVGTGIGTGVIFDGRPCQTQGMGSEFGHLIIAHDKIKTPADLSKWTVEGLASGTGLLRRAQSLGFQGASVEDLVLQIERSSNSKFQPLFDEAADALAVLCYNLSIGFHLEKILFSGGLIKIRHLYFRRMKDRYRKLVRQFNPEFECSIQVARHMNLAGVLGAASMAIRSTDSK